LFENNNKFIIPDNFNITLQDLSNNICISDIYRPTYECINYLVAFNIEKYNDKNSYLVNAYKKHNIAYFDMISNLNVNQNDDSTIIKNVEVMEEDRIYNICKGNNKIFTLKDLLNNISNINKDRVINISIITVIKDIKYLHKRSIYNVLIAPLNKYIMSKHEILFKILKTKNVNTVSSADDMYNTEIFKKNKINIKDFERELLETNHIILMDLLNLKDYQNVIDIIYILNTMNYDGEQKFKDFVEDYTKKDMMIRNYNDIFDKFMVDGFESLPEILRDLYKPPFEYYFRHTDDAFKILISAESYKLIKRILNICYEEYNTIYNYDNVLIVS